MDVGGGDLDLVTGSAPVFDLAPRVGLAGVRVPQLSGWRYANSLPEIGVGFNDAGWIVADHTETNVPEKMWYGDGRVLYGCDYGLCVLFPPVFYT
jgi:hypothetical protein